MKTAPRRFSGGELDWQQLETLCGPVNCAAWLATAADKEFAKAVLLSPEVLARLSQLRWVLKELPKPDVLLRQWRIACWCVQAGFQRATRCSTASQCSGVAGPAAT